MNQRSFLSTRPSTKPGLDSAPKRPMRTRAIASNASATGRYQASMVGAYGAAFRMSSAAAEGLRLIRTGLTPTGSANCDVGPSLVVGLRLALTRRRATHNEVWVAGGAGQLGPGGFGHEE